MRGGALTTPLPPPPSRPLVPTPPPRPPQVPLLALFGSLHPDDYVALDPAAIAAAKARAKVNLQRCVVASTDDMPASAEQVAFFLPWLSRVLNKITGRALNARSAQGHGSIKLANGTSASDEDIVGPLPAETRALLLDSPAYRDEVDLYHYALDLHVRQLAYAHHGRRLARREALAQRTRM